MDATAQFYSHPSYVGRGLPVYSGSRRQSGGSIFGALGRMILPILRPLGKSLAKRAVGVASNVAMDALDGRKIGESLKRRGIAAAKQGLQDVIRPVAPIASALTSAPARRRTRKRTKQSGKGVRKQYVKRRRGDIFS